MTGSLLICRSFAWTLALVFFATAVSGCVSFKEIKAFASVSANAASHDALTRNYIEAPDRRKQYQPEKFHGELEAQKARREAQRASLDLLQQTVTDYMQALEGLATGDIRPYDKSLTNLSSNLNDATLLDRNEKEAVEALSTILARTVTATYRLHELKKIVEESNQPLLDIISATRKIVKKGISPDLQVESTLVERYYDNFMLAPDNPPEPVAMALAKEVRAEALSRLENRLRSIQAYDVVLEKIAWGHQYLYDHRDMIGDDEFGRQLKQYTGELRAAYKSLLDISRE